MKGRLQYEFIKYVILSQPFYASFSTSLSCLLQIILNNYNTIQIEWMNWMNKIEWMNQKDTYLSNTKQRCWLKQVKIIEKSILYTLYSLKLTPTLNTWVIFSEITQIIEIIKINKIFAKVNATESFHFNDILWKQ